MPLPPHKAPASGAQALIGYDIDLTAEDGTARVTLDMADKHRNRNGTLHGGIHAMMLDAAAGFAASRRLAGDGALVPVVTLSLNTSYIGAVQDGTVTVIGKVTGGGYKIIYATADVMDASGKVVSSGAGVFKRITK